MKTLRFGIEIETIGQTRQRVAEAIQEVVGGTVRHEGYPACYDPWAVTDRQGRVWKVMADSSLSAGRQYQAEVVSPVLRYEDIPELQEVVRAVRQAGARADTSCCGIHIHVDGARFNARAVTNLVKIVHKQEALIEYALGIRHERLATYCRSIDRAFLERIEARRPHSMEELNRLWYGYQNTNPYHYDNSRYRGLNLHSLWYRGTCEFRYFNSTLHAGKVKAYIQFVLALAAKALNARAASAKRRDFNPDTAKYDFRVFLLNLGLIGEEFKTARLHLTERLQGSAAWKHGRRDRRNAPVAPSSSPAPEAEPALAAMM